MCSHFLAKIFYLAGSVNMLAIRSPAMDNNRDFNVWRARRVASVSHPD
jgi:hypothetical protein